MSYGPMTHRGRGVNPKPRDPGVYGSILLKLLRRDPGASWPVRELLDAAGLSERVGWPAVERLYRLGMVARRSQDSFVRVVVTPLGRRCSLRSVDR